MKETAMPPVPWQGTIWKSLCESIANDRLPHALLLHAMDGVGVEDLSLALVRYILCHAPIEDLACGRCKGCQLLSADSHPDLFLLKREDASQIKVDQVRSCVDFVSKTAHFDHYKVVLVEEAERMNANAANALLKSLEEPQGKTVFLLVTTQISRLLATIKSRCQSVHVPTPAKALSLAWLDEQKVENAELLLQLAGGAPLKAKSWADSEFQMQFDDLHGDLLSMLAGQENIGQLSGKWQKWNYATLLELQVLVLDSVIKSKFQQSTDSHPLSNRIEECLSSAETPILFRLRDSLLAKYEQSLSFSNLNEALLVDELAMDWLALRQLLARGC